MFQDHKVQHGLEYTSELEHNFRRAVFHSNRRHVNVRNRQFKGYELSVNHFAHKTDAELASLRGASPLATKDEEQLWYLHLLIYILI